MTPKNLLSIVQPAQYEMIWNAHITSEAGHYTNDSEYIHDLIRREQERRAESEAIRAALHEGENSGKPRGFDAESFKQRMLAAHG